jgi:toxin ParE1/3/4
MKRRLIYLPEALADLTATAAYTRRTWGDEQAKRYIGAMVADIKALRISAMRYPLYNQVYPDLRRKRSAMHHIYYLAFADRVEIVRILHVQRDPGLHLKAETWSDEG